MFSRRIITRVLRFFLPLTTSSERNGERKLTCRYVVIFSLVFFQSVKENMDYIFRHMLIRVRQFLSTLHPFKHQVFFISVHPRGFQAHGFESCPRSECRLGFLTVGKGFLAGGL
ncbi:hypothetical protein E2C01_056866 [Portunus trituberculatus]|uniref:Uncharacterized protein n=1 Tax=Portunus trituberculatus TaxID=210409 RepID=A0A5B7GYU9_PORTR|nr:hypothetical protein [Portunus trituberculatus]